MSPCLHNFHNQSGAELSAQTSFPNRWKTCLRYKCGPYLTLRVILQHFLFLVRLISCLLSGHILRTWQLQHALTVWGSNQHFRIITSQIFFNKVNLICRKQDYSNHWDMILLSLSWRAVRKSLFHLHEKTWECLNNTMAIHSVSKWTHHELIGFPSDLPRA